MPGETQLHLDFESGSTSAFDSIFAHDAAAQVQVVTSPDPGNWGNYVAKVQTRPGDVWPGNNKVMCLLARTNSGESAGQTYYFAYQCWIPSGFGNFATDSQLLWELHNTQPLYSLSAAASIAPYAIHYHVADSNGPTGIRFRIATGDAFNGGSLNNGYTHQELNIPLVDPVPNDVWIQFIVGISFTEASTGSVKVWVDETGSGTFVLGSPVLSRTNIPTLPYCSSPSVHNQPLYTQLGLYTGTGSVSTTNIVYTGGSRRELSFANAVAAFGSAPPVGRPANTVLPVITGGIVDGDTLTVSDGTWTGGPSFTYQWLRDVEGNGVYSNVGAAVNTYTLAGADVGCNIRCDVTATNGSGSTVASAAKVGPVQSSTALLQMLYDDGTTHAFQTVETKDAAAQLVVGTAQVRAGWANKSCLIKTRAGDFWPGDNTVRACLNRSNSDEVVGQTLWWGRSIYLPSTDPLSNNMFLWELRNPAPLSFHPEFTTPHAIHYHGGDLCVRVATGNGTAGSDPPTFHPNEVLLASPPADQWIDLKWTIFFHDTAGYVRYWVDPTGQGNFAVTPDVEFTGIPTMQWSTGLGVVSSAFAMFTKLGLRYATTGDVPDTDTYYDAGTRRATTEAGITAFFQPTAPPPPPPPVVLEPTTSLLDLFNRVDSSDMGPNWGVNAFFEGNASPAIVNEELVLPGGSSSVWWRTPVGPNCETYVTVDDAQAVLLLGGRLVNPGTPNASGYAILADKDAGTMKLIRIDNRAVTVLDTASVTVSSGDMFWWKATGTSLFGYQNDGSGWAEVVTAVDTRYQSIGYLFLGGR